MRGMGRTDGFSLIEVLVVVTIMALMASVAVLVMPGKGSALDGTAADIRAALAALSRESVVSHRILGVRFGTAGYEMAELRPEGWHRLTGKDSRGDISPVSLSAIRVAGSDVSGAASAGRNDIFRPHIWFLPTGEQPVYDLALSYAGETVHVRGAGKGLPEVRHAD